MKQLPIFVNLTGRTVVLKGKGAAADAKRRLIERAGGKIIDDCTNEICKCARIAFVAIEDNDGALAEAERLRAKGLLVNVVDRPDLCDFTTPAIVDRDPVLIAIGTGGASAGLAKAIRQRLEAMLPQSLGKLASALLSARSRIKARWPEAPDRRRAIDAALAGDGVIDPFREQNESAIESWLSQGDAHHLAGLHEIAILSGDPEELTLRSARLLGEADHIFHDAGVSPQIIARARADAERHPGPPPDKPPPGLVLYLRLQGRS